jgi:hypothetical protein
VSSALLTLLPHTKSLTRAQTDTLCALPCSATSLMRLCQRWVCSTQEKTPLVLDWSAAFAM